MSDWSSESFWTSSLATCCDPMSLTPIVLSEMSALVLDVGAVDLAVDDVAAADRVGRVGATGTHGDEQRQDRKARSA
jgi:hypothetical protein